ncbi:MAG: T9SS type A sorting domain-containing protein, partial [Vicingaceae bacterium]
VTLNFNSEEAGIEILRIVNMNGQVVYSEQRTVQTGVNTVSLNLSSLESGNYILALGSEQSASTVRFIKQ